MYGLEEVDRIEVLTLIDNYVDLLLTDTNVIQRPRKEKQGRIPDDSFVGEHGLSLLVCVFKGDKKYTMLFDTGYTKVGLLHNMDQLDIDKDAIEAIVISHGHMDHTGCLYPLLDQLSRPVTFVVHPDAFVSPRYISFEDDRKLPLPNTLCLETLRKKVQMHESRTPTLLLDNMVMVTGEIERITSFEKGLPNAFLERNGKVEKDSVADDQALVLKLKNKGLVVISGCSHAGIINTIHFARKFTTKTKVHAVLGGFHLGGPQFEGITEQTIDELKTIDPEVICPMHCTGWKATQRFSQEFPGPFVLNSVGSKLILS